jgi:hypothetical protein
MSGWMKRMIGTQQKIKENGIGYYVDSFGGEGGTKESRA